MEIIYSMCKFTQSVINSSSRKNPILLAQSTWGTGMLEKRRITAHYATSIAGCDGLKGHFVAWITGNLRRIMRRGSLRFLGEG
jgi:hypothetical protein